MKDKPLNVANAITIFRLMLAPVFVVIMLKHRQLWLAGAGADVMFHWRMFALTVFCIAAVSDALDGFIARHFDQRTVLGTFLDPITDKLLLNSAILVLTFPLGLMWQRFPFWFPIVIFSRELIIALGLIIIVMMNVKLKIQPSIIGKVTTFFQMLCVVVMLIGISEIIVNYIIYATAIFTVISCAQYAYRGLKLIHEADTTGNQ